MIVPQRPRLLLFAGPNGSGKSTVTTPERLQYFGILPERYINADDIARTLKQEVSDVTQEEREREAFRRARALRSTYREQGVSFAFETVFSHPSTLIDMRRCRDLGFEIVLFVVTTRSAEINVARVADRFLLGGHNVPEDRIRQRHERTMRLLPRILEDSDTTFVMDNSGFTPVVFQFVLNRQSDTSETLPLFLQKRLAEPLTNRTQEREAIALQYGGIALPNEENGEYVGAIVWQGVYYAVQETTSGIMRHDLLLFDAPLRDSKVLTIRYKDNAATLIL